MSYLTRASSQNATPCSCRNDTPLLPTGTIPPRRETERGHGSSSSVITIYIYSAAGRQLRMQTDTDRLASARPQCQLSPPTHFVSEPSRNKERPTHTDATRVPPRYWPARLPPISTLGRGAIPLPAFVIARTPDNPLTSDLRPPPRPSASDSCLFHRDVSSPPPAARVERRPRGPGGRAGQLGQPAQLPRRP